MKTGIERIDAERARQISVEGWTPEHDDAHPVGQLAAAGKSYRWHADTIVHSGRVCVNPPPSWPWERQWWKPTPDPVRNWEKAGALYRAEAERARRAGDDAAAHEADMQANAIGGMIDAYLSNTQASGAKRSD